MQRKGVSVELAKRDVMRRMTLIGALMVRLGDADAMICGTYGQHQQHLEIVSNVIGLRPGARRFAAMNLLLLPSRTLFICDTYVNQDPSAEEIADMTFLAAEEVRRFGLVPKVALCSHSNFGSMPSASAGKMARARELIEARDPTLEVEGEMHGDAAISEAIRSAQFPNSQLKGEANLLIMPSRDAAMIAFDLARTMGEGLSVGPIIAGLGLPCHVVNTSITVRGIVNMTAVAVVDAQTSRNRK
jgi:malate dehydrogenase (oxaloacetate-decarboxylating)(NADP+)